MAAMPSIIPYCIPWILKTTFSCLNSVLSISIYLQFGVMTVNTPDRYSNSEHSDSTQSEVESEVRRLLQVRSIDILVYIEQCLYCCGQIIPLSACACVYIQVLVAC